MWNKLTLKYTAVLALLLAASVALYFGLKPTLQNISNADPSQHSSHVNLVEEPQIPYKQSVNQGTTPTNSNNPVVKAPSNDKESSQDELLVLDDLNDRLSSLGYLFDPDTKKIYENYGTPELEALGDQGDLQALFILTSRYAQQADMEKSDLISKKAVMFGSTAHAGILATSYLSRAEYSEGEFDNDEVINALGWFGIMEEIGDMTGIEERDKLTERLNLDLTAVDWDKVKQRTQEIYNELEAERHKRGLGEFETVVLLPW